MNILMWLTGIASVIVKIAIPIMLTVTVVMLGLAYCSTSWVSMFIIVFIMLSPILFFADDFIEEGKRTVASIKKRLNWRK